VKRKLKDANQSAEHQIAGANEKLVSDTGFLLGGGEKLGGAPRTTRGKTESGLDHTGERV